jgi:hypothetical protein
VIEQRLAAEELHREPFGAMRSISRSTQSPTFCAVSRLIFSANLL